MIQISHHYRQFPSFCTTSRLISIDRPVEGVNTPADVSENVMREIREAFKSLETHKGLTLIECITHVCTVIARSLRERKIAGDNSSSDIPGIAKLIMGQEDNEAQERIIGLLESHLDRRKKRMAAVKVGESDHTGISLAPEERGRSLDLALYTPEQLKDGGMRKVRDQARPVMKDSMTGCTLTDKEIEELRGLGSNLQQSLEMEDLILANQTGLLQCQIKVLINVLREWFTNGVLRLEVPELGFRMDDLDTLTLKNYLEVNRTLDDAKILKNFSIALRNLNARLNLLMTYCDKYKADPETYTELMQKSVDPLRAKALELIEEYKKFLGEFEARERAVRGIDPV